MIEFDDEMDLNQAVIATYDMWGDHDDIYEEDYRKQKLQMEVKEGLLERQDEYKQVNEEFHMTQILSIDML